MAGEAFQIKCTPPDIRKQRLREAAEESQSEMFCLTLAPFHSAPKITFDAKLGKSAHRRLVILNPTNKSLEVLLTMPKSDTGFEIDFVDFTLVPKSEVSVNIGWVPSKHGNVSDKIRVRYGSNQTSVMLIGKCSAPVEKSSSRFRKPPIRNNTSRLGSESRKQKQPKVSLPENPVQRQVGNPPEIKVWKQPNKPTGRPALKTLEVVQSATQSWSPQKLADDASTQKGTYIVDETTNESQLMSFVSSTPFNKDANFQFTDISMINQPLVGPQGQKRSSSKELKFEPNKVAEKTMLLARENENAQVSLRRETFITTNPTFKIPDGKENIVGPAKYQDSVEKPAIMSPKLQEILTPVNVSDILAEYLDVDTTPKALKKSVSPQIFITSPEELTVVKKDSTLKLSQSEDTSVPKDVKDKDSVVEQVMKDLSLHDMENKGHVLEQVPKPTSDSASFSPDSIVNGVLSNISDIDIKLSPPQPKESSIADVDISDLIQNFSPASEPEEVKHIENITYEGEKSDSAETYVIEQDNDDLKSPRKDPSYLSDLSISICSTIEEENEELSEVIATQETIETNKRKEINHPEKSEPDPEPELVVQAQERQQTQDKQNESKETYVVANSLSPNRVSIDFDQEMGKKSPNVQAAEKSLEIACLIPTSSTPTWSKPSETFSIKISPPSSKQNIITKPVQRKDTFVKARKPPLSTRTRTSVKIPAKQQRQTLIMPIKDGRLSAAVRHPNPFTAKNLYYDERWVQKQENGFRKWLNFILTPRLYGEDNEGRLDLGNVWKKCSSVGVAKGRLAKAPTRETMSIQAYTQRREMNKLRKKACILWMNPDISEVMTRVEIEIEKKCLVMRSDRNFIKDAGLRKKLLELLLNYNPLWLQIGLETVYSEILNTSGISDVVRLGQFIMMRLLSNPDILLEFAHPTVPHHYRPGLDEAIRQFALRKILQLVYFLDQAKSMKLMNHDPCLFRKDSKIKMSKDILLALSRDFLSGEGNLVKHLSFLKYHVTYKQTSLDEFDYGVTNIAEDLRNGIILCRVMEVLVPNACLTPKLRMPAQSKLQRVHNVELALRCAFDTSPTWSSDVTPKDIVDGNTEKCLAFIWELIFGLQLEKTLPDARLQIEARNLEKTLKDRVDVNDEVAKQGFGFILECKQREKASDESVKVKLLLQWVRLVCAHYGLEVENLTVSFSDGRVLCYLLHHYFPSLLEAQSISSKTTLTQQQQHRTDSQSDDSFGAMTYSFGKDPKQFEDLLKNEKANFKLFSEKLREISGVPLLIQSADMINTIPDEKVTVTFLAYFATRMLDLSLEMKAARTIQLWWKKCKTEKWSKL